MKRLQHQNEKLKQQKTQLTASLKKTINTFKEMLAVKLQYEELIARLHQRGEIKVAMKDVLKNGLPKASSKRIESCRKPLNHNRINQSSMQSLISSNLRRNRGKDLPPKASRLKLGGGLSSNTDERDLSKLCFNKFKSESDPLKGMLDHSGKYSNPI